MRLIAIVPAVVLVIASLGACSPRESGSTAPSGGSAGTGSTSTPSAMPSASAASR